MADIFISYRRDDGGHAPSANVPDDLETASLAAKVIFSVMQIGSQLSPAASVAPDAASVAADFLLAAKAEGVNPLHGICLIAACNLVVAGKKLAVCGNGPALAPWASTFAAEPFPSAPDEEPLYDSVEFAGEAALYRHFNANPDLEILFTGAVGWQIRGIDAIARRKSDGIFILCEAKGTSNPLASPLAYLRETKTKGRQFGWQWCWNSLIDMAEHPATAAAFLMLLEPLLHGKVERLLAMTRATREKEGWRIAETRIFPEVQLREHPPLAQAYPLEKQRRMFAEIVSSTGGAALLKTATGFSPAK